MANSSQIATQLNIFLQKKAASRVKNLLWSKMPVFELFFALAGDKKAADGLGRPSAGDLAIGRVNEISRPMREKMFRERTYLPLYQTTKPSTSEVKSMSDYDSDPTVPNWDTTNAPMKRFAQPRFRFHRAKMPLKIPHTDIRTARSSATTEGQAAAAVGSVYDVEVKSRMASLIEKLNADLWLPYNTGIPADEDATQWSQIHSLHAALKNDNTYAGIDRSLSANSWWRGNYSTSQYSGTFEDLIEYINYDLGLIAKGLSVQVLLVGKTLMKKAKAEARAASYQLISPQIPDPEYGFKREMVAINSGNKRVFVCYDPQIDTLDTTLGTKSVTALDPSTWTVAVHPDANFKVGKIKDGTDTEGGDEADFSTIEAEIMIACEVPAGNAVFTDVV